MGNTNNPSPPESSRPVEDLDTRSRHTAVEAGIGLCLSGGGYRAMLFHLGTLWRLNEIGYLLKLNRVSSVSGGSITAGLMGLKWSQLDFDQNGVGTRFLSEVVEPIRRLAGKTIDRSSVILGALLPGSISEQIIGYYRDYLFGGHTLQDLPDDPPRFVINATNVQSGALWRFMKPYMRDWRVGEVRNPETDLATAVGASSAFPPFLSPVKLKLEVSDYTPDSGAELQEESYLLEPVLTDGGVYDNLGLETVWKRYDTVLVSDAGGKMKADPDPKLDWARHSFQILELIDNQVRSLRKRQTIDSFVGGVREGAYWGIGTDIEHYELDDSLDCPHERTLQLANTPTRLKRLSATHQERLINWGYAVCDAAMRKHVDNTLAPPIGFPYPTSGVG